MQEDIFNKFNFIEEDNIVGSQIPTNQCLDLSAIPHLGQYGNEYEWLTPCMAVKCEPRNRDQQRTLIYNVLPTAHIEWFDDNGNSAQRNNLMSKDTDFYIINYDGSEFCKKRLNDYGDKSLMARINVVAHSYLYPMVGFNDELKDNVLEAIYMSCQQKVKNQRNITNSNLHGIEECLHDVGKLKVNVFNFLSQQNLTEVHLHPTDQGCMAISPNNACFLLNMSTPITSFVLEVKQLQTDNLGNTTSVFLMNLFTQQETQCPLMQELLKSLQAINYLEHLADINSDLKMTEDSPFKEGHNLAAQELRNLYL